MSDPFTLLQAADPARDVGEFLDVNGPSADRVEAAALAAARPPARPVRRRRTRVFVLASTGLAACATAFVAITIDGGRPTPVPSAKATAIRAAAELDPTRSGIVSESSRTVVTATNEVLEDHSSVIRYSGESTESDIVDRTRWMPGDKLVDGHFSGVTRLVGSRVFSRDDHGRWTELIDGECRPEAEEVVAGQCLPTLPAPRPEIDTTRARTITAALSRAVRRDLTTGGSVITGVIAHQRAISNPVVGLAVRSGSETGIDTLHGDVQVVLVLGPDRELDRLTTTLRRRFARIPFAEHPRPDQIVESVTQTFVLDYSKVGTPQTIDVPQIDRR